MAPSPSGVTSMLRIRCWLCSPLQHRLVLSGINEIAYVQEASLKCMYTHRHQTEHPGVFCNIRCVLASVYGSHGCSSIERIVLSIKFHLLYSVILSRKTTISLVKPGLFVYD